MQRCGRLGSHRNINGTLYGPDSSCCKTFVVAPVAKSLDFLCVVHFLSWVFWPFDDFASLMSLQ